VTVLHPLSAAPLETLETLLDRAFGTDRHERTAYAIRAGTEPLDNLSFVAMNGDSLAGSLQSWPVQFNRTDGGGLPLVMVGPVAVHPNHQGRGIGKHMTQVLTRRLDIARQSAMMIGDPDYYEPFGFRSGPAADWTLPGPVEPHRILLRAAPGSTWPADGELGPDLLRSREGSPN